MRSWIAIVALLCASASAAPPRSDFLKRGTIFGVVLSPDGAQASWLADEGTRRAVWVQDLNDNSAPRRLMAHTAAQELTYTSDARWLLLASPTQLYALAMAGQPGSGLLTSLDEHAAWRLDTTRAAAITRIAPTDRRLRRWHLQRLTVGGAPELLHDSALRISGYALDSKGSLRWLQHVDGMQLVLRSADSQHVLLSCAGLQRCTPIVELDGSLWLRGNLLDGDPQGLARLLRMDADGAITLLARDPRGEADLDFAVLDPSGVPRIAGYRSTRDQIVAIDQRDRTAVEHLQAQFPDSALRPQISRSRWLIEERHRARPFARWHLYDPSTLQLSHLIDERAGEQPTGLLQRPYTWTASDGMRLHGFITVPPGDPRSLPLVVAAHGGPWSHWQPGYHPMAQFMASRGAIVFQPNHRGSTGHGHAYLVAANGDFGIGRVQRDIDDGVRALLKAGIGDPTRVAIVGASFGGYAALLGVTFSPDLYRAAVAFVPPPDFAWTLKWVLRNAESVQLDTLVPMASWLKMLQLDVDDATQMASLRAQSPLANIALLARPVVIVAGGSDARVGIAGIIEYTARARLAGKDVDVLIDHDAGHRQRDDTARETSLYLLEQMLHQNLGLPAATPPDPNVRAYIEATRVPKR